MEFRPSIWVKEGDFAFFAIASVRDAIDFLDAWPSGKRNSFYYLAANSLQSAVAGAIEPAEARDVFEIFCRETGILVEAKMLD
ncbi:DUF982 domain-containing protein [Aminobacter aganoensis]|uniref:DUF982 domain-containing protein n=1 Tax=Aminobacter aganoensis TaxID=83264 RepID=A0A7X0FDG1_9HYPH|nr:MULTISPECIES: DUF982 domain-containing protein [Aminobacter]KQU71548.1 hypothetical protein ASC75_24575 [Aminobacter sp. DSM 101952]MBB6357708.1 hypothetical protein [Aminobacter aganoensis]